MSLGRVEEKGWKQRTQKMPTISDGLQTRTQQLRLIPTLLKVLQHWHTLEEARLMPFSLSIGHTAFRAARRCRGASGDESPSPYSDATGIVARG